MLHIELNEQEKIAIARPEGKITEEDLKHAAQTIDPYLENYDKLNGLIIYVKDFPGWDSFSSLIKHLKFVKDHHKKLSHVAFVTDSAIGNIAEHFANHFVNAKIKSFPYNEFDKAKEWIMNDC